MFGSVYRIRKSQFIRVSQPDTKKPNKRRIGKATNINTNMPLTHINMHEPANTKKNLYTLYAMAAAEIWNTYVHRNDI